MGGRVEPRAGGLLARLPRDYGRNNTVTRLWTSHYKRQ
jgi:hypothetical protein